VLAGVGARIGVRGAGSFALLWATLAATGFSVLATRTGLSGATAAHGFATAVVVLVLTASMRRWDAGASAETALGARRAGAFAGAALLAGASWLIPGAAHAYVTAFWGLCGLSMFAAGLFFRMRAFRTAGLSLLGLATVRLFLIDMDSALTRIFAFGALAIVLLAVGYLYQKFRDRIGGD
jgi:hypothetical protein